MTSIGLLGGTYNPPHVGHLVMAREARDQLGLDEVRLVPTHTPPHKEVPDDPGPAVRLALCALAAEGEDWLSVDPIEIERAGPSYTVDTLRAIHATSGPGDELTFIVGGDMAQSLPAWRSPGEVLELARLAVAERAGVRREDIASRLRPLGVPEDRVRFFDLQRLDVSSSMIRRRVASGRSIRWLVPDPVAAHIADLGLYRVGATPVAPGGTV